MEQESGGNVAQVMVRAAQREAALAEALRSIAGHAQVGELIPERGSLSLPFRGEGADLPALLIELSRSLLAEIDQRGEAVSDVSVNGVLSTETGLTAWGYATVARGAAATLRPVAIDERPEITEVVGGVTISFPLRIGTGA